ncbi:thioredoxin domain-containing protein 3 homolog, partial [Clonorchis sinensis]
PCPMLKLPDSTQRWPALHRNRMTVPCYLISFSTMNHEPRHERRRMAKKKVEVALQEEIETQEEWESALQREGLISTSYCSQNSLTVIDIYQDWAGPCKAAAGIFRRMKTELNDDLLNFAIAKADTIDSLVKYRGKCEPCFLFFGCGKLVAAIRGVNPPELEKNILEKLKQEHEVLRGEAERVEIRDPVFLAQELAEEEERRRKEEEEEVPQEVTIAVLKPDIVQSGRTDELIAELEGKGISVIRRISYTFTKEEAEEFYVKLKGEPYYKSLVDFMISGPSEILLCAKGAEGVIEDLKGLVGPAISEASEKEPGLRAKYASDKIRNAIHAPDSKDEAARELAFFFPDFEPPIVTVRRPRVQVTEDDIGERQLSALSSGFGEGIQRTVALLRPKAYSMYKDSILEKIKEAGFVVASQKEVTLSKEQAEDYYKEHRGETYFGELTTMMSSGPCLALLLARQDAVDTWRKLLGPKDVAEAKATAPESLRAQYVSEDKEDMADGKSINLIHGSASVEEAQHDIERFFPVERTLAAVKPDAYANRDEIIEMIKSAGFHVAARKDTQLDEKMAAQLYENVKDKPFFDDLVRQMTSGRTLFMVLTREDAIAGWRQLMGPTDPDKAADEVPASSQTTEPSIRAAFGRSILENAVHGSSSAEQASATIQLIFGDPSIGMPEKSDKQFLRPSDFYLTTARPFDLVYESNFMVKNNGGVDTYGCELSSQTISLFLLSMVEKGGGPAEAVKGVFLRLDLKRACSTWVVAVGRNVLWTCTDMCFEALSSKLAFLGTVPDLELHDNHLDTDRNSGFTIKLESHRFTSLSERDIDLNFQILSLSTDCISLRAVVEIPCILSVVTQGFTSSVYDWILPEFTESFATIDPYTSFGQLYLVLVARVFCYGSMQHRSIGTVGLTFVGVEICGSSFRLFSLGVDWRPVEIRVSQFFLDKLLQSPEVDGETCPDSMSSMTERLNSCVNAENSWGANFEIDFNVESIPKTGTTEKDDQKKNPYIWDRHTITPYDKLVYENSYWAFTNLPSVRIPVLRAPFPTFGMVMPLPYWWSGTERFYPVDVNGLEFQLVGVDNYILRSAISRCKQVITSRSGLSVYPNRWTHQEPLLADWTKEYQTNKRTSTRVAGTAGADLDIAERPTFWWSEKRVQWFYQIFKSPQQQHQPSTPLHRIRIYVRSSGKDWPSLQMDESYAVLVDGEQIFLVANETWGALRGLESLSQLMWRTSDMTQVYINQTYIFDKPRFPHRGLLVDTSRHFISKSILLVNLEAMAYNKLNVLHWHIVDDNSFPYQSQTFPSLSQKGAWHKRQVYTQHDIKEIVEFARLRGIRVIPEFDIPGHTRSLAYSKPELLAQCQGYEDNTVYFGPLNPFINETYQFIENFLIEMFNLFPDEYIHLGGDEVQPACWDADLEMVRTQAKLNLQGALTLDYFWKRVQNIITELGNRKPANRRKIVVWQEVAAQVLELIIDCPAGQDDSEAVGLKFYRIYDNTFRAFPKFSLTM